jgi:hypothetical protein
MSLRLYYVLLKLTLTEYVYMIGIFNGDVKYLSL